MYRKNAAMKVKAFDFDIKAVSDDGLFSGYGSVFDVVDSYNEVVAPGAFIESIEETRAKGRTFPVLWQHSTGEPIGNWDINTLKEDKHGLFGEGALWLDDAAYAKTAWRGMKTRAITGLSIGYYVRESNYDEKTRTEADFTAAGFPTAGVTFLDAQCATKEISYTGGQKSDIDVTTLCSTEQEQTNGLAAPAEMSVNRNWVGDEAAQLALQTAYENDELRALKVVFPSGNGFYLLVEVRQSSWSAATSAVVGATYSLRVKGKSKRIVASGS